MRSADARVKPRPDAVARARRPARDAVPTLKGTEAARSGRAKLMTAPAPAAGAPALPLALVVAPVGIVVTAASTRAAPRGGRAELELAGILPTPDDGSAILVLREKGTKTILPVIVPGVGGAELRRRLDADEPPGALGKAIQALGGRVREVEIAAAEEVQGAARIRVAQGGRDVTVDARPSESIPLAVAAGAPILAPRKLMDASGLTPNDLERAKQRLAHATGKDVRL
jgi:uncharacterized protein